MGINVVLEYVLFGHEGDSVSFCFVHKHVLHCQIDYKVLGNE